jgi:hypothetical protein
VFKTALRLSVLQKKGKTTATKELLSRVTAGEAGGIFQSF